jgi:hypothetical protein
MSKSDMLYILMLLSALESWALAHKSPLPEYLSGDIKKACDTLRNEILSEVPHDPPKTTPPGLQIGAGIRAAGHRQHDGQWAILHGPCAAE